MPHDSPTASAKAGGSCSYSYSYAVIRLMPRVERGECLNVGVILFARELGYLAARIAFDAALPLDGLARLAAAEQRCCAFFSFAITLDHHGAALEVRAPDGAGDMVAALFGSPS